MNLLLHNVSQLRKQFRTGRDVLEMPYLLRMLTRVSISAGAHGNFEAVGQG